MKEAVRSDEELAWAAARGDREAFADLLERHHDRLFRLFFRLTGRREEAEDLTQETCLALPGKLRSFRGESAWTTWLYRIAVNSAHDHRRRAARFRKVAEGWGEWEKTRRAEDRAAAAERDWLRRTMTALPTELRDTVALLFDGGLTHAEAAKVLGVAPGTVSWRMSEVRRRLRALWQEESR